MTIVYGGVIALLATGGCRDETLAVGKAACPQDTGTQRALSSSQPSSYILACAASCHRTAHCATPCQQGCYPSRKTVSGYRTVGREGYPDTGARVSGYIRPIPPHSVAAARRRHAEPEALAARRSAELDRSNRSAAPNRAADTLTLALAAPFHHTASPPLDDATQSRRRWQRGAVLIMH
jgi:hypothetical protein